MAKKITFADKAKAIEKKYSKRDNDPMSEKQKEHELTMLMHQQEEKRSQMMKNTYEKCYGGMMNKMDYGGLIDKSKQTPYITSKEQKKVDSENQDRAFAGQSNYNNEPASIDPNYGGVNQNPYNQMVDKDLNNPNSVFNKPQNKFDYNSLYNLGNFAGGVYDIYRGLKGPDKVNYDRVNPNLVNYSDSRNMINNELQTGFRGTRDVLKNVNSPGQYLSLITNAAANRDQAISDNTSKSFENEKNTNAQLINQSKYFNAQTQRSEADARQMEKDQASNTLQRGLESVGAASAQIGSDKAYTKSDDQAIKAISSKYPDWEYNKQTGMWKHKSTGEQKATSKFTI